MQRGPVGERAALWGVPAAFGAGKVTPALAHILRAADQLDRTPAAVARRLELFGHVLPDDVEFTDPDAP
ncbi:wHTH domain-containing protein [Streptomyces spinoverrucosus]|uniref:wHTH domain-containing protein n=1 Tax=Streptomyces spinoverrucosus TaxID=284043 RepID=UPI0040407CC3